MKGVQQQMNEQSINQSINLLQLSINQSNLFAQIHNINIGSSKSVHEQGQQGWKQH